MILRLTLASKSHDSSVLGVGGGVHRRPPSHDSEKTPRMVAGFGYGTALSLVTGMRGPRVMSVGVICALISGGLFKLDTLLEQAEDALHNKKKGGFSSLGIGLDHAMNFNKDLLTHNSLPLLSDGQEDVNRGGGRTCLRASCS
ncbi:hypothetical protein CTI12_AA275950 [Artemisia annua]|uniref:Uncharacterized protein n=1 Tax=Artemisia annua TaxID=35608 RepID=A0A2U1NEL0_ARTAN|nr:hypothetical protein CTI12_AA275950 [Artemisia annua]